MLPYPKIDPIALKLGPLKIHWYGLMYLVGFAGGWWLGVRRAKRPGSGWQGEEVGDMLYYIALGVILGGRLGYVLFYNLHYYLSDPVKIFYVWDGGMSFHGGLIGVMLAMWWFGRKTERRFFQVADFVAPLVPVGLFAGRIGNFINGELWGRVSDVPWAMVFPTGGPLPRHPSQLYEAGLEGIVLFLALWFYSSRPRPSMAVSGLFLLLYGCFRFFVEFFRQPDVQLGFVAFGWMSQGQLLSLPMIVAGLLLIAWAYRRQRAGG